jgi:hypothetical protein
LHGAVDALRDTGFVHGAGLDLSAEWTDHDDTTPGMDHRPQRRLAGTNRPLTGGFRQGPLKGTEIKRPVTGHNDTMGQMWDHPTLGCADVTGARKTLRLAPITGQTADRPRAAAITGDRYA